MIELKQDQLVFRFPEVHEDAVLRVEFQRTLRIPDDDKTYPLPPGLGRFPMVHVDDHANNVPPAWLEHGGVMLPMYQSEALWINFRPGAYPFAVRVLTGKIDAVTGKEYRPGLGDDPQNYLVVPGQPWLDGYCVSKGVIRQFVAMPLGAGYSAEEQITGQAEHGGIQLVVYPLDPAVYERLHRVQFTVADMALTTGSYIGAPLAARAAAMGLAPGGRMRQHIYHDTHALSDWHTHVTSRVFVHLANSLTWRAITGKQPPTVPPTAREYAGAGLPWFNYYSEQPALEGSGILNKLKSVWQMGQAKGDVPLPENEPVADLPVIELRRGLARDEVRQGRF